MKDPEAWVKPEEIGLILDKAKQHSKRNYLILYLLGRTGRRIGELLDLKVRDISFERAMVLWSIEKKHKRVKGLDGRFIKFEDDKGKSRFKTEKVFLRKWKPIDKGSLIRLTEYLQEQNLELEDYVFFSPIHGKDRPMSRVTVWIFLSKYAKELGIEIHPHSFRHSFAIAVSNKIKSPADLKKLSDLLEHSSIQVTEGYMQFAPEETRELLEETFS